MRKLPPPIRLVALAALTATLLVGAAATPPTTAPATAPSTQPALTSHDLELLQQLESGTWRQRRAAEQELGQLGAADAPRIAAMLTRTRSPEAQARLTAVLKQMDQARRLGGSLITLHYHNAPAKTVYASLFAQAWAPLKTVPNDLLDSLPPISIDADHEPFWTVVQRLGKLTRIGVDRNFGASFLSRGGAVVAGPQAVSGGFLVVLSGIRPARADQIGGNAEKDFWLDLSIYPEPKLNVQSINAQVDISHATDDHGNSIKQRPEQAYVQTNIFPANIPPGGYRMSLLMTVPEKNPGTDLVDFRATLKASVILESARFDIPNLTTANVQSVNVNGLTLKYTGCKKVGGHFYQVSFETGPDPQNRFQQTILPSASSMSVIDKNGHAMQIFGSSMSFNPTVGVSLSYIFGSQAGIAAADRLVWEIPTAVHTVDIQVDFHDLKLDFAAPGKPGQPEGEWDAR